MTIARREIVDLNATRYYHCISRCVRGIALCGEGFEHRKDWIVERLKTLAGCYAVSVASYAVMDNHFHLLIRVDPHDAEKWSDEEILRRWLTLHPPQGINPDDEAKLGRWIEENPGTPDEIEKIRNRLASVSWFHKDLKEPLARIINREDGCRGTVFEGRFKSIAVIGEAAISATSAYIDLNPVAAGVADTPENSQHTSARQRLEHVAKKGQIDQLKSAREGSVAASQALGNIDQDDWLIPIEDRRPHTNSKPSSEREGMFEKFTLGNYLLLVDYTGRLYREGKARISDKVEEIFDRLDACIDSWNQQLTNMLSRKKLRGHRFSEFVPVTQKVPKPKD